MKKLMIYSSLVMANVSYEDCDIEDYEGLEIKDIIGPMITR